MDGVLAEVVLGLLPTVGVSLLFAGAIWAIVRADAAERADRARIEAEEDAADREARGADEGDGAQETHVAGAAEDGRPRSD